jgi:hypothetical protein
MYCKILFGFYTLLTLREIIFHAEAQRPQRKRKIFILIANPPNPALP